MSRGTVQQMPFSPVETCGRTVCARRCAPGDEVKYPAKLVMRDDASIVLYKLFLSWQQGATPHRLSPELPSRGANILL